MLLAIRLVFLRKQKDRYFRIGLSLSQERETGLEVHRLSQIRIKKGVQRTTQCVSTKWVHYNLYTMYAYHNSHVLI